MSQTINGSIFVETLKNVMMKPEKLERTITNVEREVWCAIRRVVRGLLGNHKYPIAKSW